MRRRNAGRATVARGARSPRAALAQAIAAGLHSQAASGFRGIGIGRELFAFARPLRVGGAGIIEERREVVELPPRAAELTRKLGDGVEERGKLAWRVGLAERATADAVGERLAPRVGHHVVAMSADFAEGEEGNHAGMLQPRGQPRLVQEAARALGVVRRVGAQRFG